MNIFFAHLGSIFKPNPGRRPVRIGFSQVVTGPGHSHVYQFSIHKSGPKSTPEVEHATKFRTMVVDTNDHPFPKTSVSCGCTTSLRALTSPRSSHSSPAITPFSPPPGALPPYSGIISTMRHHRVHCQVINTPGLPHFDLALSEPP